jgi:hypothetical protein|eukprot:COSAG01_NODE_7344_length_3242_cov_7.433344_3_plen_529_part_00
MLYDDSVEDAAVGPLGNGTHGGGSRKRSSSTSSSWFAVAEGCSVVRDAMNGNQSLQLDSGCVAVNRGLVAAGPGTTSMHFVGGEEYEGYLFTKAKKGGGATLQVSLLCTVVGSIGGPSDWITLGKTEVEVIGGASGWQMHNFTITPSTDCLQSGSGKSRGQGLVSVSLGVAGADASSVTVRVDKLMLEPGPWGRYEGMHVRKDLAEAFLGQGVTMMRLGGSMTNTDGFRFRYMVGPSWSRPPTDSNWIKKTSWGFGIFEFLQFNEKAGLQPYLCLNFDEDMPGLLEYLYGNSSTPWGAQRITDGHAEPYSTKIVFICSNEEPQQHCSGKAPWPPLAPGEKDFQCYIQAFTKWAAATKDTAISLGVWPLTVGVALDSGAGRFFSPGSQDHYRGGASEMIKAIVQADLGPVLWDQHGDGGVAAGWGDGRDWQTLLSNVPPSSQSMEALTKAAGKWVKTIMLEENGGGCGLSRALGHVSNSLSFQRFGHQMVAQSAAGMMWSGALLCSIPLCVVYYYVVCSSFLACIPACL